eukprot:TRINITY_DN23720_c0_g1_i2.p1 TRINITY_DN23720_c0_g1~~TRINITY_DN23720_c0_g1_i2.p1  ORF type:complete len:421 (-),score=76.42 TRINITY_DN23720_c0_g1_i2:267-1529(-)
MASFLNLKGLLYCVFDAVQGSSVGCQDNEDGLNFAFQEGNENGDVIGIKMLQRYLLPLTSAKGLVMSVEQGDFIFIGAPVFISDKFYPRNIFQFTICMVVPKAAETTKYHDKYHEVAHHLAFHFEALEREKHLLWKKDELETAVQPLLKALRSQLNERAECFVPVGNTHCIAFKIRSYSLTLPPKPDVAKVPIPWINLGSLRSSGVLPYDLDPLMCSVIPYIDGRRKIQEICEACRSEGDDRASDHNVVNCIQHLMKYRLVSLIDAIDKTHRYSLTPTFRTLTESSSDIGRKAVSYVTGKDKRSAELTDYIISMYARMAFHKGSLGDFLDEVADEFKTHDISWRSFIIFGLLHEFLERGQEPETALTKDEMQELKGLRKEIKARKDRLRSQGREEVNKDEEVRRLVDKKSSLERKAQGDT